MKLQDMMNAAICMSKFSGIQPENNVSLFVSETFDKLFPGEVKDLDVIKGIIITFANKNPEKALEKMQDFLLIYQNWYLTECK